MLYRLITRPRAFLLVTLGILSACTTPPQSMWYHRGPESLLDVSSEVATLNIASQRDLDALAKWIATDAPTRADLQCSTGSKICRDAVKLLEKHKVNVTVTAAPVNVATLVYERIVARDCEQQYRTQRISTYSEPSASFGCATSANIVQMVSDKSSFINPSVSDNPSASSGADALKRLSQRKDRVYSASDSLTSSATSR